MSQIDKWNEKRKRKNQRKGHPIQAANVPLTPAPDLPKSIHVDDLRVDGDIDLSFFDTLEPDQTFMVNPTGAEQDQIYTVNINEQTGQPEVQAQDPTSITTAPPTTSDVASDNGTPAWAVDPTVDSGPGWMKVRWLLASGTTADPLFYNVFMDTTPGFTPNFSTNLVSQTFALEAVITLDGLGAQVVTGTDYYFKIQAISDLSGNNATSNEVGPFTPAVIDASVTTFSNVDAGTITVGLIDASQLNANEVMANTINSIMIDTQTMLAGDEEGNYVRIDENGIVMHNADGDVVVLPTDGSPAVFTGRIIANELTVINGATIQGETNVLDEAAVLTLNDVQANPPIVPTVIASYENAIVMTGNPWGLTSSCGLFYDETNDSYWRMVQRLSPDTAYIQEIDATTGAFIRSKRLDDVTGFDSTFCGVAESGDAQGGGVCRIGDYIYFYIPLNFISAGGSFEAGLYKIDEATLNFVDGVQIISDLNWGLCTLGTDGTNLLVVDQNTNGTGSAQFRVLTYDPDDIAGGPIDTQVLSGGTAAAIANRVPSGIVAIGLTWWISACMHDGSKDYVEGFDTATGIYIPDSRFYTSSAGTNKLCGLAWHTGLSQFVTNRLPGTENPSFQLHTDLLDDVDISTDHTLYFAYRWDDGSAHTTVSGVTAVDVTNYRRARLALTVPTPPSGMVSQIFALLDNSVPADADLLRQTATSYIDTESGTSIYMSDYNPSGSALTTDSNTFGAGNSIIQSNNQQEATLRLDSFANFQADTAGWQLKGDGTVRGVVPAGIVAPYVGKRAPFGWLLCNGQSLSRSTYPDLFEVLCTKVGTVSAVDTSTETITTPANHGLILDDRVVFETGAPTGITAGTEYFVISAGLTATAFRVSASRGGSAVNITGTQTGAVIRWLANSGGSGDNSTTFTAPDLRGRIPLGHDSMQAGAAGRVAENNALYYDGTGGADTVTLSTSQIPAHDHAAGMRSRTNAPTTGAADVVTSWQGQPGASGSFVNNSTDNAGGGNSHTNMPPYKTFSYIIKW